MKDISTKKEFEKCIIEALEQKPTNWHKLFNVCKVQNYQERLLFINVLSNLQKQGKIFQSSKNKFVIFPNDYFIGTIKETNNHLQVVVNDQMVPFDQNSFKECLPGDTVVVSTKGQDEPYELKRIIERNIPNLATNIIKKLENGPLTYHQIKNFAKADDSKARKELNFLLEKLEIEGKIYADRYSYYPFPNNKFEIITLNSSTNSQLFYQKDGKRIYLDKEQSHGLLPKDVLLVDKSNGSIKKIIHREPTNLVFEVKERDGIKGLENFSFQDKSKILVRIDSRHMKKLCIGDKIIAEVSSQLTDDYYEAEYVDTIKAVDDLDIDLVSIALSKGFHVSFTENYQKEVEKINTFVTEEEMISRYDFRDKQVITIDCDSTKDMDDAISIEILPNGHYLLGVHIADVAHYVKPDSEIYKEAAYRSTSVYMLDTVIPMLDKKLSNGICSLNPNVDRLTKSCLMEFDTDGKIIDYKFVNSVINSKMKMSYSSVNQALEGNNIKEEYLPFLKTLTLMNELSDLITIECYRRGKLNFASSDVEAVFDDEHNVVDFTINKQNAASKMIENFMVSANTCCDKYLSYIIPFSIHRSHREPSPADIEKVYEKLRLLNYKVKNSKNKDPRYALQGILESYAGTKDFPIISKICLTATPQAKYTTEEQGHYGLGLSHYTHFTSPIRRFPDLRIHLLLDQIEQNQITDYEALENELSEISIHASHMERQADAAEHQALVLKMMEYIDEHPDQRYHGTITDICQDKIYVTTSNHIPGYVNYEDIDTETHFSSLQKLVINEHKIPIFRIGHEVALSSISADHNALLAHFKIEENLTLKQTGNDSFQKSIRAKQYEKVNHS